MLAAEWTNVQLIFNSTRTNVRESIHPIFSKRMLRVIRKVRWIRKFNDLGMGPYRYFPGRGTFLKSMSMAR